MFVLYVYTPAVGYYYYYYYSFIRFVSLGLEFGLGLGLGLSEHWCLLAWFGKENGNPARHTGREGGLAVAHKAWSFGGGSCMMGIENSYLLYKTLEGSEPVHVYLSSIKTVWEESQKISLASLSLGILL